MTLGSTALTTLSTVKDRLGITGSGSDTLLEALINAASEAIVGFCGRKLHYEEAIVEYARSFGTMRLQVTRAPIWGVDSITIDGSTIDSDGYEILGRDKYAGAIYATGGWPWSAARHGGTIAQDPIIGSERYRYVVTYDAGYITPSQSPVSGVDSLPQEIQEACIMATTALYARVGQDPTVTSESLLSYSVSYASGADGVGAYGLPPIAQALLGSYRWMAFA